MTGGGGGLLFKTSGWLYFASGIQTGHKKTKSLAIVTMAIRSYTHISVSTITDVCRQQQSEDSDDGEDIRQYKAVSCTGRQPDSNVFVFGPEIQFTSDGQQIPPDQQEFVWIPQILQKLDRVINPLSSLGSRVLQRPLHHVLHGMDEIAGDNLPSGIYMLGMPALVQWEVITHILHSLGFNS